MNVDIKIIRPDGDPTTIDVPLHVIENGHPIIYEGPDDFKLIIDQNYLYWNPMDNIYEVRARKPKEEKKEESIDFLS